MIQRRKFYFYYQRFWKLILVLFLQCSRIRSSVCKTLCTFIIYEEDNYFIVIGRDRSGQFVVNGLRSIYQYSNMAPRLTGQASIFGVVFFVSKSLLGIEGQKKQEKFAILTRKPWSHARILIYRTWLIRNCAALRVCSQFRSYHKLETVRKLKQLRIYFEI